MPLQTLSTLSKSRKTVPTSVEFVDIAGLVKGASEGQGLGNKFLANIRECDSVVQVGCLLGRPCLPAHGSDVSVQAALLQAGRARELQLELSAKGELLWGHQC